jgi:hypothetical protein
MVILLCPKGLQVATEESRSARLNGYQAGSIDGQFWSGSKMGFQHWVARENASWSTSRSAA